MQEESDLGGGSNIAPAKRCFKFSPWLNLHDAVKATTSIRDPPQGRPDLKNFVPDDEDGQNLLDALEQNLPAIKARPSVQGLIQSCKLTDDDIKVLALYKLETPYPLYRWLNGFLQSSRRDNDIVNKVGPLFTLLYRAMEKLPKKKMKAARSAIIGQIPGMRATFDNYQTRLAPGQALNFWSFSSFSTDDVVINQPSFIGAEKDDAIVYTCGQVEGVDMEPFKPPGMPSEAEILPLCPAVFVVQAATMIGHKLSVTLDQQPHEKHAYVKPEL